MKIHCLEEGLEEVLGQGQVGDKGEVLGEEDRETSKIPWERDNVKHGKVKRARQGKIT